MSVLLGSPSTAEGGGCTGNPVSHLPSRGFLCTFHWLWDVTHPGLALCWQLLAFNESPRLQRFQLGAVYKTFPCSDPWGVGAGWCF